MGMSLYYTATRATPLTEAERSAILGAVAAHPAPRAQWEDFCLYNPPFDAPDTILEGATGLPMRSAPTLRDALQHWCALLTALRRLVPDAEWSVSMDDHPIPWDDNLQAFDPFR